MVFMGWRMGWLTVRKHAGFFVLVSNFWAPRDWFRSSGMWNSSSHGLTKETLGNCPSCRNCWAQRLLFHHHCWATMKLFEQVWNCFGTLHASVAKKRTAMFTAYSNVYHLLQEKTGQLTLPLPSRRVFTWNLKPNTYRNGMAIIKPCMYSTFTYI